METFGEVARRVIDSPVGRLLAAATERGVCRLWFDDSGEEGGRSRHLDQLAEELAAYFDGRLRRFTVPLDLPGTPFRRSVWAQLLKIPYGETISYDELARRVERSKGQRAVGQANGANPVAIVVPCHRVVAKAGTLGGYAGGLDRKRWLLEHEGALGSLFGDKKPPRRVQRAEKGMPGLSRGDHGGIGQRAEAPVALPF